MQTIHNYIGGKFQEPKTKNYLPIYNPATGEIYAQLPDSDSEDVELAVQSGQEAFLSWSSLSKEVRANYLLKIADGIERRLDYFAEAESNDNGKPLSLAKAVDIPRAISNFRFFAGALQHFSSESHSMEENAINYTLRDPLGVVACISPWNLPLYLFTWKIAPALAMGNCVVAKPSEVTPATSHLFAEVCQEIKLPAGVLNLVHGYGHNAGEALVKHPLVPAVSFTGGTKTGAHIASIAAPMFKKISLELGGKNPNIIFADCSWELALETSLRAAFSNQGQICLSGSRIFIERPIYEKFKEEFVRRAKLLKVGDPLDSQTNQGAVVSFDHYQKILSFINRAKEEGLTILAGGKAVELTGRCARGWFIEPTIIEGAGSESSLNQEEVFGPLVTLNPFDKEEEVLEYANSTPYGLASCLWTENLSRAHRMSKQLKSGIVWVNCWMLRDLRTPFGGMKNSGTGREGGWEALRFFTEPKNVCIQY